MRFTKMHGLGNDYVYVNGFDEPVDDPHALARAVSDRHRGVGSDGLILLLPPEPGVGAHVRMRMFNVDGSEGEMCGNGVRCLCKLAYDHGVCRASPMRVQTGGGVVTLRYDLGADGRVDRVSVDMGEPVLASGLVPAVVDGVGGDEPVIEAELPGGAGASPAAWADAAGYDGRITAVSMGNPHGVLFCESVAGIDLPAVGPGLEHHAMFPRRANIHFVQVQGPDRLVIRHWERGSGATLACGTGACASVVAAALTGRSRRRVTAVLPGGELDIEWRDTDQHVVMTGPAVEVFRGAWPGRAGA